MTYQQCLDFLYQRNQFAMKLGLNNIQRLLKQLDIDFGNAEIIHVAGTNGKGSLCFYLYQLLRYFGVSKIGLYTSPHLVDFRERVRVNGKKLDKNWMVDWFEKAIPHILEINSSYFETVTAMAFDNFRQQNCDVWILETGLGGRLDATNAAPSGLTAISSIGMDHENILGNSLARIAREKLGILKKGVPMALGDFPAELLLEAKRMAEEKGSPLWKFDLAKSRIHKTDNTQNNWVYSGGDINIPFRADLEGMPHQIRTLDFAFRILEKWMPLSKNPQVSGSFFPRPGELKISTAIGRLQYLRKEGLPDLILDCGHNEEAWDRLVDYLKLKTGGKKIYMLHSIMGDKNFKLALSKFCPHIFKFSFVPLENNERALKAHAAGKLLEESGIENFEIFSLLNLDWKAWLGSFNPSRDLLCICGSFYLLGEVLPKLAEIYPELSLFKG